MAEEEEQNHSISYIYFLQTFKIEWKREKRGGGYQKIVSGFYNIIQFKKFYER